MASQPDAGKAAGPQSYRKAPHSLTTGFFGKARKAGDGSRSPVQASPTVSFRGPPQKSYDAVGELPDRQNHQPEPVFIPPSPRESSKSKKLAPHTFNSHYRSISRSMNDLGSIFSRGRSSPPQYREQGFIRPPTGNSAYLDPQKSVPESPHSRHFDASTVPAISIGHHTEVTSRPQAMHEGWLNVIDGASKKGPVADSWKLYQGIVNDQTLLLHKPPPSVPIRAFAIDPNNPPTPRPQSAPATAAQTFNASSLQHKSTARHPDLKVAEDGTVVGGTVEALCHELMFTKDSDFVRMAVRLLSAWTGPETALSVLLELSGLQDLSARIYEIVQEISGHTPGLLLDPGCYNCARLLVEKGIGSRSPEYARKSRNALETAQARLQTSLQDATGDDLGHFEFHVEDILETPPAEFASQVYFYHRRYFLSWNPKIDVSLLLQSPHLPPPSHRNPLIFSSSSLHFLSELVMNQVLTGDSVLSADRRATLISHWIFISRYLYDLGDLTGYIAVVIALLSPPVIRLKETWSLVRQEVRRDILDGGCQIIRKLDRRRLRTDALDTCEPYVFTADSRLDQSRIPYFGDLLHCMDDAYSERTTNINYKAMVDGLRQITSSLERWVNIWDSCDKLTHDIQPDDRIQAYFEQLNRQNHNPPSICDTSLFEKSLACEPSHTGLFVQSHYHQQIPLSTGANIPLLFTEVQNAFSLFDRSDTLAIAGTHRKTPSTGLGAVPQDATLANHGSDPSFRPSSSDGSNLPLRRTRSFPPSTISSHTTGYNELDFTTRERSAVLHGGDDKMLRAIRDVAGVGQQLFHSKDGELVVKSIIDETQSRPASIIIETTSQRLSTNSRRQSEALGESASKRNSRVGEKLEPVLVVVPKGGTLERLVDILVLGVEEFSKRMIPSGRDGTVLSPSLLRMDRDVFSMTFFATFRSYCSPVVLIDYLKKRLMGAKTAASSVGNVGQDVVFPDWSQWTDKTGDKIKTVNWSLVANIHTGILNAINTWLSEFFDDFYCDQFLGEAFLSFLGSVGSEIKEWEKITTENPHLRLEAVHIKELWNIINDTYSKLAYRPRWFKTASLGDATVRLRIPMSSDSASIADFIDILDHRSREHFNSIKLVDWMLAFEVLETQSAEPLGFFVPKLSLIAQEDDEPIQSIFTLLSNLRRRNTTLPISDSLAKPFRDLLALQANMVNWMLAQVVDTRLSVHERAQRIATLLQVLAVVRGRMSGMAFYDKTEESGCRQVPSFVGNVISAALVRPECRIYNHAWQLAIKYLHGSVSNYDTLEQVIPRWNEDISNTSPMTPCVGWMLERLLEIVCHVPNMVVENERLINFDKRRYVYNFINNFTNLAVEPRGQRLISLPLVELPDYRRLRDCAAREMQQQRQPRIKLFQRLISQELEKLRRDAKQRELLERQQKMQHRQEIRRQQLPAIKTDLPEKKAGKRLGVNTILKHVRPISMAFTGNWPPPQQSPRPVGPSELPPIRSIEPSRKPAIAVDLKKCISVQLPRDARDRYCWKLVTETGNVLLLQAPTEDGLDEWIKVIETIRGQKAYQSMDSVEALNDTSASKVTRKTFGVRLEDLCARDGVEIPVVVESLLREIEERGMSEPGIYRIAGSLSSVQSLKAALDSGQPVSFDDDRWYDINVVAGTFKAFMRELPERPISPPVLSRLLEVVQNVPDDDDKVPLYRDIVADLPPVCYNFLRRIYQHFEMVASNERVNRMTKVNLAIVFGPGLGDNASTLGLSQNLGDYQQIVRLFIGHVDTIFPKRDFQPVDTVHAVDASPDEQSPSPDGFLAREGRSPNDVDSPRSPFAPRKSLEEFRGVVSQSAAIG